MPGLPTIINTYYGYVWAVSSGLRTGNIISWRDDAFPSLDAAGALAHAQVIADSMALQWGGTLGPAYPNDTVGWDSRVYPLQFPLVPAALGHSAHTGSGGVDKVAIAAGAVIGLRVNRRGRGSQSHNTISPLPLASVQVDGQTMATGAQTFITTEYENFIAAVQADYATAFPTGALQHVQVSKKHATTFAITGAACEALLGTERSRTHRP